MRCGTAKKKESKSETDTFNYLILLYCKIIIGNLVNNEANKRGGGMVLAMLVIQPTAADGQNGKRLRSSSDSFIALLLQTPTRKILLWSVEVTRCGFARKEKVSATNGIFIFCELYNRNISTFLALSI